MNGSSGFASSYISFWKRALEYKGLSTLREYWQPVGLNIGLAALAVFFYVLSLNGSGWAKIPFWVLTAYLIVSFVPFVALTVRRLRDTGMSGLWALLLLFVGAGTCVVLCLCAAGSSVLPSSKEPDLTNDSPDPLETNAFDPANAGPSGV